MTWDPAESCDDEESCPEEQIIPEVRRRILASIGALAGGVVFVMLFLGFYAADFPWYANLTVVLSTIVIVPALLVGLWIHWGLGMAERMAHHLGEPY